ncbi:MAG TPA: AraC family transcriptional regulator [Puia sp.]
MNPVRHLNAWQPHLDGNFTITRLEDLHQQSAAIHRHEHFEMIYLTSGKLDCKVDMGEYLLSAGSIGLIQPGKLHNLSNHCNARGYLLCFAPQFCRLPAESALTQYTHRSHWQVPGDKQPAMTDLLEFMKQEHDHGGRYHIEVLSEFLKIFLIYLGRHSDQQARPCFNRGTQIFEQFMGALERKYLTHRRPADYAEELFLSTSYLNQTIKAVSGRTTSYHIHQRVVLEAQRMAVYANSSLKEAASNLGFEDICHFSRFFKKAAGQSFKSFKQRAPLVAV